MKNFKKQFDVWLPSVIGRICVFEFTVLILVLFYFILGNFQQFLENTQFWLLQTFDMLGTVFLISGVYYIALLIFVAVRFKYLRLFNIIITFVGMIIIALGLIFSKFILSITLQ